MEDPDTKNVTHKKRNVCRMLKTVIFVVCLTGFGFQTAEFLTNFYTYPTVLNTAIETMEDFPIPALTFCSKYLFKFEKYCKAHNRNCQGPKDKRYFCEKYFDNSSECMKENIVTPVTYPNTLNGTFPFETWEVFPTYYFNNQKDFTGPFPYQNQITQDFEACYRAGNGVTEKGLRTSRQEGSRPTSWKQLVTIFNHTDNVYFQSKDHPFGWLFIHSPFISFKRYMKAVNIKRGYDVIIYIRLEMERLLPSPYKTDCVDYIELWKKNNKTGPLSREMCQHACMWNNTEYFEEGNLEAEFCYKSRAISGWIHLYDKERHENCHCWKACKDECLKLNYHITTFERKPKTYKIDSKTQVYIHIESNKVRVLVHRPQYLDVELFSYIGGFLGCWLGISFWALSGILWKGYAVLKDKVMERINHKDDVVKST